MTATRVSPHAATDLRRRIALPNRSRLRVGRAQLASIAATLAASRHERARFMQDPATYLRQQALPVLSCRLTAPAKPPQTAEVVSAVICCTSSQSTSQQSCNDTVAACDVQVCCVSMMIVISLGVQNALDSLSNSLDWQWGAGVL